MPSLIFITSQFSTVLVMPLVTLMAHIALKLISVLQKFEVKLQKKKKKKAQNTTHAKSHLQFIKPLNFQHF